MAKGRARRGRASENVTCLAAATFVNYVTESENYSPWRFFFFFLPGQTRIRFSTRPFALACLLCADLKPTLAYRSIYTPPPDSFPIPVFTPRPVNSYETCGGRPDEKVEKRVQVARIYNPRKQEIPETFRVIVFLGRGGEGRERVEAAFAFASVIIISPYLLCREWQTG